MVIWNLGFGRAVRRVCGLARVRLRKWFFVFQILFERAAGDFFHAHEKLVDPAFGFMSFEAVAASSKINSFRPQAGGLLSFV
ncbi:hypothetical protein [Lysobacter capsici]|uniref:hypothetical protein n=1 Tax=Lysobacter capsici TaxID=435897 RepID=UPI00287BC2C4|nr:hypothetical protein [Lysobacter capsici]WND79727.1 hypothetical protein RJ610_20935 [Lysobacter capsici]WND84923.1 hypothetical protein RJ609_20950 [Lysobacter capsici]